MSKLVYATRKSALALAQSRAFIGAVVRANPGAEIEELLIVTSGDRFAVERLQDIGGKGLFVKELEEALLDGRADLAVHSIKDVPAELAPGLALVCVPAREDPRDVLVTRGPKLAELPAGARIGTSSLRRAVSLKLRRPDLVVEPLRGNVDTRLRRVEEGAVDGIVLAQAGLVRLGIEARGTEVLEVEDSLPAVGQGALGIETRSEDPRVHALLAAVHDAETSIAVSAERGLMASVGGTCRMPIAAHGQRDGDALFLRAFVADPDGTRVRRGERRVAWPKTDEEARAVGRDLGQELR